MNKVNEENIDSNNNSNPNSNPNNNFPDNSSLYIYTLQDLPLFQILLEYSNTLSRSAFKLHLYCVIKLLQSSSPITTLNMQDFCKEVNIGSRAAFLALKELHDKGIFPNSIRFTGTYFDRKGDRDNFDREKDKDYKKNNKNKNN